MKTKLRNIGLALAALALAVPAHAGSARKSAMVTKAPQSWVRLKASTDKARYTAGQPVLVRLTAANTGKRGAYLRFTSGQRFDFTVRREGSRETAYTWSASRMFMASLGSLWLKPGQSQKYEANIGEEMGRIAPGKYVLNAHLTNSPHGITAPPVRFEVADIGLAVTAKTDKTTYAVGEGVHVDVAATNTSGKENIVPFESGMTFDVIISDKSGKQVWTYGALIRFFRVLGTVTWEKGETKKYAADWNGVPFAGESGPTVLKPGRYKVQAVLQSTPLVYAEPLFITIR